MFGSVVPQYCKWVELLQCVGLKMMVHVVKWEWIFEMNVFGVIVVVEVYGRDNMELGCGQTPPPPFFIHGIYLFK